MAGHIGLNELSRRKRYFPLYDDYWLSALLRDVPTSSGIKVLDYGCGAGLLLDKLKGRFNDVYAIDIEKDLIFNLQRLQENTANTSFLCDGKKLAFKDNTFDLVICRGVLHHIKDITRALSEIKRILKSNGYLIISEPTRDNNLWRMVGDTFTKVVRSFPSHHHIFTTKELKDILKKEGLLVISKTRFGSIAFPIAVFGSRVPLLKYISIKGILARILIYLDRIFTQYHPLKLLTWHIILTVKKIS